MHYFSSSVLTFVGLFASSHMAQGTPDFTGEIQNTLSSPTAPPCTLCHTKSAGGDGTVKTPFGSNFLSQGLRAHDKSKLRKLLASAETKATDSDGDGVPDITELKAGTDPNQAETPSVSTGGSSAVENLPQGEGGAAGSSGIVPINNRTNTVGAGAAGVAGAPSSANRDAPSAGDTSDSGCTVAPMKQQGMFSAKSPFALAGVVLGGWLLRRKVFRPI